MSKEDEKKPTIEEKPTIKEKIFQDFKLGFKFIITGLIIAFLIGGLTLLLGYAGLKEVPSYDSLIHAGQAGQAVGFFISIGAFIIIAIFIFLSSKLSHYIGLLIHEQKEMGIKDEKLSQLKQLKPVPAIAFAIFASFIITGVTSSANQFLQVDLTSPSSVYATFTSIHFGTILIIIGAGGYLIFLGWLTVLLKKTYPSFYKYIETHLPQWASKIGL